MKDQKDKGNNYKLLLSGDHADLTLTCGDRVWNVHQVVLCPQSGFFRAACKEEFKESKPKKITIVEDDPIEIWAILLCLYRGFFAGFYHICEEQDLEAFINPESRSPEEDLVPLLGFVKLYALGDKYDIPTMRRKACSYFEKYLEAIMDDDKEIPAGFESVYRIICNLTPTNDKGLRPSLAQKLSKYIGRIVGSENTDSHAGMDDKRAKWSRALEEDGEMVLDILKCLAQQKQEEEETLNDVIMALSGSGLNE